MAENENQKEPEKYWTALPSEGKTVLWVNSKLKPDWRKKVVGGDRRKRFNVQAGSNNVGAKLKETDIVEIHLAYRRGETQENLAKKYGVSRELIRDILAGKKWAHAWSDGPSQRSHSASARRGEKSPLAKLDSDKVVEIRTLARQGFTATKIAEMFRVNISIVCDVLTGRRWKEVSDFGQTPIVSGVERQRKAVSKLGDIEVRNIRLRAKAGESQSSIAARFGVCQTTVLRIIRRETYAHVPDAPP